MTSEIQQKVDARLQRIANIMLVNSSFIPNLGLLNGKMGAAIFFYHYAKYTDNKVYDIYAGELIDEIYEEIGYLSSIEFANGLSGIAWGIEYLVQGGFLEADSDEILEEVDEKIYTAIQLGLTYKDIEGCILYQLSHIKSITKGSRQKELLKNHTLLCLLDECEKILMYRNFKASVDFLDRNILLAISHFLKTIDKEGIFPQKTKKLLEILPAYLDISELNINEKFDKTIVERTTSLVWEKLVYISGMDNDDICSVWELFEYIDKEENWNRQIELNKNLSNIGISLLQLKQETVPTSGLQENNVKICSKQSDQNLSVFVFKSNSTGMQYGIGSYIKELTENIMIYSDVKIFLISYYNTENKEFSVECINPKFYKIKIPSPPINLRNDKYNKKYANIVTHFLSSIIPENEKVIFQINSINIDLLRNLKEIYTHPIIFVVHIAFWQLMNISKQNMSEMSIDYMSELTERMQSVWNLSDRIVALTTYMRAHLINEYGISPEKIDLIPNGINYDKYKALPVTEKNRLKKSMGFHVDEKIILFIGRVNQDKGIFFLIDAFIEVCKQYNNLRLVIIGNGEIEECMKRCKSFIGKITFTGFIEPKQIANFYQIVDIGVSPSLYDQCPYTVLEMMANNIPLILSKIEGLDEMLTKDGCVFINPIIDMEGKRCFDIEELSKAILFLLHNSSNANKISHTAYSRLITNYSAREMVEKTINLYLKTCADKIQEIS